MKRLRDCTTSNNRSITSSSGNKSNNILDLYHPEIFLDSISHESVIAGKLGMQHSFSVKRCKLSSSISDNIDESTFYRLLIDGNYLLNDDQLDLNGFPRFIDNNSKCGEVVFGGINEMQSRRRLIVNDSGKFKYMKYANFLIE